MHRNSLAALAAALILAAAVSASAQDGMPYADATARLAGRARDTTVTTRFNRGHPYVETYVEGKGPYSFVLDTGASFSVVLPAVAKSLGLKERKVKGTKFTYVEAALRVPGAEADRHRLYTFVGRLPGVGVVGLLGHDFLRQFVVEVDYSRPAVVLHDPRQFRAPAAGDAGWGVLTLRVEKNSPVVPVRLNFLGGGSAEFTALIDTGANYNLMLTPEAKGTVGERLVTSAALDGLALSPVACCDDVPVHQLSSPPFPFQMILPGSTLRESGARLVIDYPAGKVYVSSTRR